MGSMPVRRAYRIVEAATLLSVSRWTIWRQVRSGQVRAVRISPRSWRIPADEVERLATEGVTAPRAADGNA